MNLNINWTKLDYQNFLSYLNDQQDLKYRDFHKSLLNADVNLIGIRTPKLKKIAKEISLGNYDNFIKLNTHKYYEETIIHALVISNLKDINIVINYIDNFLNYIDNWATCDILCGSLKIVNKNKEIFFNYIKNKIKDPNPWIKRFCFVLLLDYFLEDKYIKEIFNLTNKYNTKDYYVNMAIAWLISIAYIKNKNATINYLKNNKLDNFTHNKAIQKIKESTRTTLEDKELIKNLRRK